MSVDPDRARQEVADVERLARRSLADVRETVGGLRRVTLAGELTGARTALRAAGIDAVLPAAIDDVPSHRDELYGWVVREGTTNVVRHSGASRCEILLSAGGVEVHDNGNRAGPGAHPGAHPGAGLGLRGLSERVEAAGGTLTAGPCATGGFRLVISAPVGAR
jgi:two-component system sensor histidine kinase DesK